jgi:hypothetical protein
MEISVFLNICKAVNESGTDGIHYQATDDRPCKTAVFTYLKTDVIFTRLITGLNVTKSNTCPVFHLFRLAKARPERSLRAKT